MSQELISQFVTLWVVIDPIGTLPVFVAVTASIEPSMRWRVALQASAIAAGVLMFFLVLGQFLIEALEISLTSFQIAGGIILFLFALTMIFGDSKPEAEASRGSEKMEGLGERPSPAVFPLAVPSLASPGAMLAIVVLTDNNRFSVPEQAVTAGIMLAIMVISFALMLAAGPIIRVIRPSGAAIVSRVMGMVLAAVAVDNVITAITPLVRNAGT